MLNTRVDSLPVHAHSSAWIGVGGASTPLYCDFNSVNYEGGIIGIPYNVVQSGQGHMVQVHFTDYGDESDPGPYLMPNTPPKVEGSAYGGPDANGELGGPNGSGDGHCLVLDVANHRTYELFVATPNSDGSWDAASGCMFDLNSNAERTPGWTSSCASGWSLFGPLAKYAEYASGQGFKHAIGINWNKSSKTYFWPANHAAGSVSYPAAPAMGAYMRLKANVDISQAPPQAKAILQALKTYGAFIHQNGSAGYLNGDANTGWVPEQLKWIRQNITLGQMEFVDVSSLMISPNTAQARQPSGGASSTSTGDQGSTTAAAVHHTDSRPRAKN